MKSRLGEILVLENLLKELFIKTSSSLSGRYKTVHLLEDNHFVRRRDRTSNDIHAFFELFENQGYFHLRAYTRHMLVSGESQRVFLTGYQKSEISHTGGIHSLRQRWYDADHNLIASQIVSQNPNLFSR